MLAIQDAVKALTQLGMKKEDTDKFEILIVPQINFHKFLMESLDISSEDAEKLTQNYSHDYVKSKLEEFEKDGGDLNSVDEDFYFGLAGDAMKLVALENNYGIENSQALKDNLEEISKMLKNIVANIHNSL